MRTITYCFLKKLLLCTKIPALKFLFLDYSVVLLTLLWLPTDTCLDGSIMFLLKSTFFQHFQQKQSLSEKVNLRSVEQPAKLGIPGQLKGSSLLCLPLLPLMTSGMPTASGMTEVLCQPVPMLPKPHVLRYLPHRDNPLENSLGASNGVALD